MSAMLEQAIVDAKALKEVALKNAEETVIEKYSKQIKEAVESLLEQDFSLEDEDVAMAPPDDFETDGVVDDLPLAATEGESLCPCPEEEEEIEIDFDELTRQLSVHSADEPMETSEDAAEELLPEENVNLHLEEDIDFDESELISLVEELAEESVSEALRVDVGQNLVKTGWIGNSEETLSLAEEELLAMKQDTELKEKHEDLKKSFKKLEEVNLKLNNRLAKNTDKNKNRYVARGQKDRSKFWTGIAAAMADQWGSDG